MPVVISRRNVLRLLAGAVVSAWAAVLPPAVRAHRSPVLSSGGHPDPRPGIDGSRVLTADRLGNRTDLIALFDAVREIPHIVDGIRCYCGCADLNGYRSLLSCFEQFGMAQYCEICEGQARLAHARWKEGQTLDQIRRAIDARYAHGSVNASGRTHEHE